MFEPGVILHDRYRLKGRLGHNPARQTWLAEETPGDRLVTIKLLSVGGMTHWDDLKLLEREAQVLRTLKHPHIPEYCDSFELQASATSGTWFALVTRYIRGVPLKKILDSGKTIDGDRAIAIARATLKILDDLHQHHPPILHRDIKPSNLIWGKDEHLYLIDFGAVQTQPRELGNSFTVTGTYGYAPIEQFGGHSVPASDIYALGATLVHLLTGTAPADLPQRNLRIQFHNQLPPHCNPALVRWLDRAIDPDLEHRFKSAHVALLALPSHSSKPAQAPPPLAASESEHQDIHLSSASHHLIIDIPAPFTRQVLRPALTWLTNLPRKAIGLASDEEVETWQWVAIALVGLGVFMLTGTVLLQLVPLLLIAGLIAAASGIPYFQRTTLFFNPEFFEILQEGGGRHQRHHGRLDDLESLAVVPLHPDTHRPRLALKRQNPHEPPPVGIAFTYWKIPSVSLMENLRETIAKGGTPTTPTQVQRVLDTVVIGDQLAHDDVNWLAQTIQKWLDYQAEQREAEKS